jgi:hypothetical protein
MSSWLQLTKLCRKKHLHISMRMSNLGVNGTTVLAKQATRTVRKGHADRPARCRGLSVKTNRTTRNEPRKTDRPRRPGGPSAQDPDRPLLKLGPSANQLQRKPKTKPDRKQRRARTRQTREELG